MKYLKKLFLLICVAAFLTSCGNQAAEEMLPVRSTYPNLNSLKAGEFSFENTAETAYTLSVLDETLLITDRKYYDNALPGVIHTTRVGGYWGDETGLFYQDENGDNDILTTESLLSWIPFEGRDYLFAITGGVKNGSLHLLSTDYEKDPPALVFEGMPMAAFYAAEKHTIYIATDKEFFRIDLEDFFQREPHLLFLKKEILSLFPSWEQLEIGSMCMIGNIIYMGTQSGVLSYDTVTGEYIAYPIDFEAIQK